MNFEKAIWDWLYPCPYFQSLFFLVANQQKEEDKETLIAPLISGNQPQFLDGHEYIDGSGVKEYICNISQFIDVAPVVNSQEPINSWESIKDLQNWVSKQVDDSNLPKIEYVIEEIVVFGVQEAGYDNGTVKGQFQIIIKYLYEKGE